MHIKRQHDGTYRSEFKGLSSEGYTFVQAIINLLSLTDFEEKHEQLYF